jgi:hypothetical protein
MLNSAIVQIVDFCVQRRWQVVAFGILLAVVSATYDVRRFSITTDTDSLISQKLPWHQRQLALSKAFPQKGSLVVVSATTPENAEQATNELEKGLSQRPDLFRSVVQADSGEFFQHNGMLFEPLPDVKKSLEGSSRAKLLIEELASDPSLRGAMKALSFVTGGVQGGEIKPDQLVWPLSMADKTLSDVLAGKPATFSWQELIQGSPSPASRLHHFIEVEPVLDFEALQPGGKATDAIRHSAADLKIAEKFGAKVALTGPVPLNDDQFSVIRQSALRDTLSALIGALIILWPALRSWKIVASVFFSLIAGLQQQCARRRNLHLRPEARGDTRNQARTAPQVCRRARHRSSQSRAPHGPQLSLAPSGRRCQRRPRRRRLQLPPPDPMAQDFAVANPGRSLRVAGIQSSLKSHGRRGTVRSRNIVGLAA